MTLRSACTTCTRSYALRRYDYFVVYAPHYVSYDYVVLYVEYSVLHDYVMSYYVQLLRTTLRTVLRTVLHSVVHTYYYEYYCVVLSVALMKDSVVLRWRELRSLHHHLSTESRPLYYATDVAP